MARAAGSGQGVRRIAAVLQVLGRGPRSGLRLTDVAAGTRLNKATVHRLLASLGQVGLVEQDDATGHFHLSFEMFVLGSSAINRYGLAEMARVHLARLESQSSDTTYLAVKSGFDSVCVDRYEGSYPVKVLTLNVGDRRPLGVGAGSLALLAAMPDAEIDMAIAANRERLAAYPLLDVSRLYSLIDATRRHGYAFFDGLAVPEMSAIGMPILSEGGRVIAAIGMSAIRDRMHGRRREVLVEWMRAEVRALQAKVSTLTSGLTETGIESLRRTSVARTTREQDSGAGAATSPPRSTTGTARARAARPARRRHR